MFPFNHATDLRPRVDRALEEAQKEALARSEEQAQALARLGQIQRGVADLKELLKFYEKNSEYLVKVQRVSESVVEQMEQMRQDMADQFGACLEQEEALLGELELWDARVDALENGQDATRPPQPAQPEPGKENHRLLNQPQPQPQSQPGKAAEPDPLGAKVEALSASLQEKGAEMEGVERQLASLGRFYGWPEDDHSDFLVIWGRRKSNNYFELEEELGRHLRLYTGEQIHAHIDKHRRFLELQDAKKQLLYEYRLLKEQRREAELQALQRREQAEERQAQQAAKTPQELAREEQDRREKLLQWRLMKEARKEAQALQQQEQQARLRQEHARASKDLQERRAMLNQWKEEQDKLQEQNKQEQAPQQKPKRVQSAANREAAERVKQREEEMLRKKLELHKAKEQAEFDRLRVLSA